MNYMKQIGAVALLLFFFTRTSFAQQQTNNMSHVDVTSIVKIYGYNISDSNKEVKLTGVGILVDNNGSVLTNFGTIANIKIVKLTNDTNEYVVAKTLYENSFQDIALLQTNFKNKRFINLGNSDSLKVGGKILSLELSKDSQFVFNEIETAAIPKFIDGRMLLQQKNAAIGEKVIFSFNINGDMMCMSSSIFTGDKETSFMIPINRIKNYLANYKPLTENASKEEHLYVLAERFISPDETLRICEKILEINPESSKAYKIMGLIQLLLKEYAKSQESLTIALSFAANSPYYDDIYISSIYSSLASIYALQGRQDKNLENQLLSIKYNPVDVAVLIQIAAIFQANQDYSKAFEYIDKAILIDPQSSQAYFQRAVLYTSREENSLACRDLLKCEENLKYQTFPIQTVLKKGLESLKNVVCN